MSDFKSTHDLPFMCCRWPINQEYIAFEIGTCHGIYTSTPTTYDILAIQNEEPGNGHLADVFDWFINSCKRDKRDFRFLELMNPTFRKHLIDKKGFLPEGEVNLIKRISSAE